MERLAAFRPKVECPSGCHRVGTASRGAGDRQEIRLCQHRGERIQGHGVLTSLADYSNAQQAIGFETQVKYAAIANKSVGTPGNTVADTPAAP